VRYDVMTRNPKLSLFRSAFFYNNFNDKESTISLSAFQPLTEKKNNNNFNDKEKRSFVLVFYLL
jgi:hypothetical protein